MWKCHKCGKPVYFAERKQSLGYDWHPECLRCQECDKRLNPGQHAEHKGEPFCYTPCYSVLFGPTLYGHGSQVETHTSFGKYERIWPSGVDKAILEAKLKVYNNYYDGNSGQLKWKERNSQLILEGQLHIYWGVDNLIHLKENDDQRHHVQLRKRYSCREAFYKQRHTVNNALDLNENIGKVTSESAVVVQPDVIDNQTNEDKDTSSNGSFNNSTTNTENGLITNNVEATETKLDESNTTDQQISDSNSGNANVVDSLLNVDISDSNSGNANAIDSQSNVENLPLNGSSAQTQEVDLTGDAFNSDFEDDSYQRERKQPICVDLSRVQIRKLTSSRSRTRLKRRCSINGHYYNRETKIFTPPKGSASNVWISSMVTTKVVINLLLDKFRIENNPEDFALFVVRDNGEIKLIKDDDYPLLTRLLLGPHEQVAKVYIMDRNKTNEVSNEVAQYLNFQEPELVAILHKFDEEEANECVRIRLKFDEMRRRMISRLDLLRQFHL